jgi:para-nitrobenzyl esterase
MAFFKTASVATTRRTALLLSAGGGVAALAGEASASDSTKTATHQEPGNLTTPRSASASTQSGKVRGFLDGGVYTFKGVPYGQDTSGQNRWLPAKPPKPWDGEYHALIYGANCPQTLHDFKAIETSFLFDWDDGYMSEDMLKLNIWTPGLTGKRPVMVYFHGGGFSFGSAYELPSHEGAQMARHHDVVQISVNHRLNALGFLDLSEIGGPAYADSANVGMTDLVAALRWIKDNVANFGGDPDCVMIYGQSGGGSKVTCLMGMPSATGLFHRAGVQSGGGGNFADAEQSRELARQLMIELGLGPNDIVGLQKTEWATLNTAGQKAVAKVNAHLPPGPFFPPSAVRRAGWAPNMDGRTVPSRPFHDAAPEISKHIPLIIGSVSEEGTASIPTRRKMNGAALSPRRMAWTGPTIWPMR